MGMLIKINILFGALIIAGCSFSRPDSDRFCTAISKGVEQRGLPVESLYISGDYIHGVIAVDSNCPEHVLSASILQEVEDAAPPAKARLKHFAIEFFTKPKIKSGLFLLSGVVDVAPHDKIVRIKDVISYKEVDEAVRNELFSKVHQKQSN